jgi:ADP-heptose:LPS heptosyltransferase
MLPRALLAEPCAAALFGTFVEGLADRFEPALCDAYARLFSHAITHVHNGWDPGSLVARYERVRRPRPIRWKPHRILILSRVTLGADVAVTSVLLTAAKRRFPHATIIFVGPQKNHELFAGDPHVHHVALEYERGGLRQRLASWEALRDMAASPDSVVIDSDSRLTQLGLMPICSEDRYHLFESRGYGAASDRTLPQLAAAWAAETFGISGAHPYVALGRPPKRGSHVAVSFGVGENPAKRIPDPFETELLKLLGESGAPIVIDTGAGGEEAERVHRAVERAGVRAACWRGSFAGFASIIAASRFYVGYDSAGQHVAAACGVPLISIFAGFPCPRMFERWRPVGPNATVIRVDCPKDPGLLDRVREALGVAAA